MRVNLVGNSNGVGLSRDLSLLAEALRVCGCNVTVTTLDERAAQRRRSRLVQFQTLCRLWARRLFPHNNQHEFDLNIMMEHVWPEEFARASISVVVPNPEWFDRHDRRMLRHVDRVWAKTTNTHSIFSRLGKPATWVGFDSEDRLDQSVPRVREFLHVAGKSVMKGTERLLAVWRRHPEWPRLVVVQHEPTSAVNTVMAGNIEFCTGYLDDAELRRMQNRFLFHVCTSETEGWGHYLVEAMSAKAVIITVDAPPMNEFITPERGLLLSYAGTRVQKQATCYLFDEAALVSVVEQAVTMSDAEVTAKGAAARAWFIDNKQGFSTRLLRATQE